MGKIKVIEQDIEDFLQRLQLIIHRFDMLEIIYAKHFLSRVGEIKQSK